MDRSPRRRAPAVGALVALAAWTTVTGPYIPPDGTFEQTAVLQVARRP